MAANNIVWGPSSAVGPGSAFEILPDQKLDELRSPKADAYACACADRPNENFFALISDPTLPARRELTEKLATLQLDNVLTPVAWGEVSLPGLPRNSFAIAFERPRGARIAMTTSDKIQPFNADEILRNILPPLVATLKVFADLRLAHRGIRPVNLFFRGASRQLVLGEAVSGPAGAAQPVVFETIEGGMATPHCRSSGSSADDLYALAMTIIYLLLGRDPTEGMDARELLRLKIERSSFMAVVGTTRLPPELIEALRGLLADDPRERWTVADLEGWLQGRRLKPRQQTPMGIAASRPFEFNGRGYYTARAIAHAFAGDPTTAARAIRAPEFEIWLQRSLADDKRSAAITALRADASGRSGNAQDLRLAARACIALDPLAPIRYGDLAVSIDSFGQALVAAFQGHGSLQTIGDVLAARLPQSWLAYQTTARPELLALSTVKPFDMLRRFAEDPRPGYGLERVLYELNPGLACLSPLVQTARVSQPSDILATLEGLAGQGIGADALIDRHLAAFIATHARQVGGDCFDLLNGNSRQRVLGTLSILAQLQVTYGPAEVPVIGKLLSPQLLGLLDMFHSRKRRTRLQSEIARLASKGSLSELFWLLTGSTEQGADLQEFAAAQREYAGIERSLLLLQRQAVGRPRDAAELAGRLSAIVATCVAAAVALVAVLRAG